MADVGGEKGVECGLVLYVREKVSQRSENKLDVTPGFLLEARSYILKRKLKIRRSRHRDLLRWTQPGEKQKHKNSHTQISSSHLTLPLWTVVELNREPASFGTNNRLRKALAGFETGRGRCVNRS